MLDDICKKIKKVLKLEKGGIYAFKTEGLDIETANNIVEIFRDRFNIDIFFFSSGRW